MTVIILSIFIIAIVYNIIKCYAKTAPYQKVNTTSSFAPREMQNINQDEDGIFDLNGV